MSQQTLLGDAAAQAADHPVQLNQPQLEALHAAAQQVMVQVN